MIKKNINKTNGCVVVVLADFFADSVVEPRSTSRTFSPRSS